MTHPVVHFEIGCRDSAKTQEFYKKLFDWKISDIGPAAMSRRKRAASTDTLLRSATSRSTTRFFTWPWTMSPRI
jgi:predicted enzyme related to lactoylglutathione lyase